MDLGFVSNLRLTPRLYAAASVVFQVDGNHAKGVCLAFEHQLQWPGLDLRADDVSGPQHQLCGHLGLPVWKVDQQVEHVMQKKALRMRQMCQPAAPLMAAAFWELQAAWGCPPKAGRAVALHPGRCFRSRDLWRYRLVSAHA